MATPQSSSGPPILRHTSISTGLAYLSNYSSKTDYRNAFILIHGWACSAADYLPLLATLTSPTSPHSLEESGTTLFIAIDLPGHGHTPASVLPNPTVASCARLINSLGDELLPLAEGTDGEQTRERVLVGHSMGVRIALECFVQQPKCVTGVVLLDGSWYGKSPRDYKPASASPAEDLRIVREVFLSMMGPETPDTFCQLVQERVAEVDLVYVGRLRADYIRWDGDKMEEALGIIRDRAVGVLVVQGTQGHGRERRALRAGEEGSWMQFVRERVSDPLAKYIGVVVEGSGHWVHVDRVAEVAEVVKRFRRGRQKWDLEAEVWDELRSRSMARVAAGS